MRSFLTLRARLFVVAVALAASLVFAEPVGAHTDFDYSLPTDGASVGEPISEVTVAFTLPVTLVGNGFEVLDPQGNLLQPFAVTDDDTVFRLQFDQLLAGGAVGVSYTVTAEDGHVLSGAFSFTISVDLPASTTAAPSTTETPPVTTTTVPSAPDTAASDVATTSPATPTTILEDVSASEATGAPAEASASEPAATQNGDAGDDSSDTGLLIGIAIAVAVLAAAFLVFRARSSPAP